ncbi:hypothetical protein N7495_007406 [Penicillium taxi]|uniref:uncharacterized protein n=1 Tax=Penicillium taxi TaxID=168475 RepID=UPI0025455135|nr:uncharacterized protein N7495_007406 [Penicillium taxi]KAJ5887365.1 hypothetical protein N7495_007406 [Penicillium taxi]
MPTPPRRQPKAQLSPSTRSRICELKRMNGWGARLINKHAFPDIPVSSIQSTLRMEAKRGVDNHRVPGSGRPSKLTEAEKTSLYTAVEQNLDILIRELLALINNKEIHAEKRLRWAREYEYFSPDDWRRVFWSDETTVERGIGERPEWSFIRPKDQCDRYEGPNGVETSQIQQIPARGKQVKQMFWGAFSGSLRRTPLVALDGDPESAKGGVSARVIDAVYRRYLPTLMNGIEGAIFQQDNAPVHTARLIQATLESLGFIVMIWPPYSPDLNPIENIWALLKAEILRLRPELIYLPNDDDTLELLVDTAQLAWSNIGFNVMEKLALTIEEAGIGKER